MGERKRITPGAARGACVDCGYRAWLDDMGLVPVHEVRRVHFGPAGVPQVYQGTENGDERCTGSMRAPEYMPPRVTRRKMAA
jgi:hypothetical protein